MAFSPTFTHESETLPGVTLILKRIGLTGRTDIDHQTLKFRQRLRELELDYPAQTPREEELAEQLELAQRKVAALEEGPPQPPAGVLVCPPIEAARADVKALAKDLMNAAPREIRKTRQVIDEEYATVQGDIRLIWVRAGLVSISGGDVDGMTVEQLLEYGPPELAAEVYNVLVSQGRLAGPAAKNLSSPGTSDGADSQAMSNTAAENVKPSDGMSSATASDTSQPELIRG